MVGHQGIIGEREAIKRSNVEAWNIYNSYNAYHHCWCVRNETIIFKQHLCYCVYDKLINESDYNNTCGLVPAGNFFTRKNYCNRLCLTMSVTL